jgi:hypothetical protein
MTPLDARVIAALKSETGDNYPKRWSGFSVTVGAVMEKQVPI